MAQHHSIRIPAHHNIYLGTSNRELRIDFALPQQGLNSHTGIVVQVENEWYDGQTDFGRLIAPKIVQGNLFAETFNLFEP